MGQCELNAQKDALEVYADEAVPVLSAEFGGTGVEVDTGVVYQYVQASEAVYRRLYKVADGAFV